MAEETVSIFASLKDQFTGPLAKIARGLRNLIKLAKRVGRALSAPFRAFGRALKNTLRGLTRLRTLVVLGLGVQVLRTFSRFESGLTQVSTLVDTTTVSMENLKEGVIAVGLETGDSFESLNRALFDIISAGVDAAGAVDVLRTASILAAGGATSTAEATAGLVSLLNAYGLEASEAASISDSLFQAMKGGITTIGALSSSLGKVSPIAKAAGVSLDEMVSAVSALTKGGISTQESVTALRAVMSSLIKPTSDSAKAAVEFGIEFSTAGLRAKGFVGFLQDIADKTQLNEEKLGRLFPNLRALVGILTLGADNAQSFADIFGTMAQKAGAAEAAAKKVFDTLENNFKRTLRAGEVFFIRLGTAAKPFIIGVLDKVRAFFTDLGKRQFQITATFELVIALLSDLGTLIKTIFSEGDVIQLVVNLVKAAGTAFAESFVAILPLLIKTVEVVGRSLALALIRAFVGESQIKLAEAVQGDGPLSLLFRLGAGAAGIDLERLDEAAKKIRSIRSEIRSLQQILSGPIQVGELIGLSSGGFAKSRIDLQNFVKELELEIITIVEGLGGKVSAAAVEAAVEGLSDEAAALPGKMALILGDVLDTLGVGISSKSENVGQKIADTFAKGLAKISFAAKKDISTAWIADLVEIGREMGKAAVRIGKKIKAAVFGEVDEDGNETGEDNFGKGAFGSAAQELDRLNVGFQTFINNFDTFEALGASLGSALANGVSGLVDVFFQADASFKQFASNFLILIGKMIIQMTILRALAAFFFAVGGASASATNAPTTELPTTAPGLGGLQNKGGFIRRFNAGIPFVPGRRGPNADSVPALLTVGEGIIQRPSVDYYGRRAISAINARMVPRNALRALAGAGAASRGAASGGFARGGIAGAAAGSGQGFAASILPIMPTDRVTTEQLAGGATKTALMRLMREDPSGFKRSLGIQDRQVR